MTGSPLIKEIISEQKSLRLDIFDRKGQIVGYLQPLTYSALTDELLIEQLTVWRNRATSFFLTQFEATPTRTKKWLQNVVLADHCRLMFLVHLANHNRIGHVGFVNLTAQAAEGDNQMRGERGGGRDFMVWTHLALFDWMFQQFGIQQIQGRVFSNNDSARIVHGKLGFVVDRAVDIFRHQSGNETQILEHGRASERIQNQQLVYITLKRDTFYERKYQYESYRTV